MTPQLPEIFGELGIAQYLDSFVDQGFDTWETILDITESDLDALGVKLGHRRKLQRRIANFRGVPQETALISPTQPSIEDARLDVHRPEISSTADHRDVTTGGIVTKRKYRRHPKPDENAPERPPSAYVLFSNKMREDLKGRNLTFTEIAKLVGENWQSLSQRHKEPFESQAQIAKDRYSRDLAAYKKTASYKRYMGYLQDFKAKHQDKDASKRLKVSEPVNAGSASLSHSATPPRARSMTGSGESQLGSEPPPNQEHRIGSAVSATESLSLTSPIPNPLDRSSDVSPPLNGSPRDMVHAQPSRMSPGQRMDSTSTHRSLPSLSDAFDGRSPVNGFASTGDVTMNGSYKGYAQSHCTTSPGPPPSLVSNDSRPTTLRKEYSSTVSTASSLSFPRTPTEGSLPIHALLSDKHTPPFEASHPPLAANGRKDSHGHAILYPLDRPPSQFSSHGMMANGPGYFSSPPPMMYPPLSPPNHLSNGFPSTQWSLARNDGDGSNLDAISALLKAGEIVDRQTK